MSNINSKFLYSEKEKQSIGLTVKEEEILQKLLMKKDLEYLIEKKNFYKNQIMDLYDIEREVQKFQENCK